MNTGETYVPRLNEDDDEEFLTVERDEDGGLHSTFMTAGNIIYNVSMADCLPVALQKVYRVLTNIETAEAKLSEVKVFGTWHDSSDPLYIKGVEIETGETVLSGYGTDH